MRLEKFLIFIGKEVNEVNKKELENSLEDLKKASNEWNEYKKSFDPKRIEGLLDGEVASLIK